MPFHQTLILLPCHSLEDLSTHYRGRDADSILANWTVAFHPALIATTGKLPRNGSAHDPGEVADGTLILVPTVAKSLVPEELLNQTSQLTMIADQACRKQLFRNIVETGGLSAEKFSPGLYESELVADFFALGYAFLQIQLMTRQLRGSTNLDEGAFETSLVAAASELAKEDLHAAKAKLSQCFDLLFQEKNTYYPVQPDLIDLVLMAPTTLGKSLIRELDAGRHPKSILLTGELSRQLKSSSPENFERLKTGIAEEKIVLVGGLNEELAEPLLSGETGINQLHAARKTFLTQFNFEPSVFARRRFGIGPWTPMLLDQFNFLGALHCTMDGGSFPVGSSSSIRWEADDGTSMLSLAQAPADANDGHTYLNLGVSIGRDLDSAHVATVLLAHWPGKTHFCFEDLCRIAQFGSLFGQFKTLTDYFEGIYDPGYGDTFSAHEYRGNYLAASLAGSQANPISRYVDYWRRFFWLQSLSAFLTQKAVGKIGDIREVQAKTRELQKLQDRIESATEREDESLEADLEMLQAELLAPEEAKTELLINPTSFPRTVFVQTTNRNCFVKSDNPPLRLADSKDSRTEWLLDVPPMSTTRLPANEGTVNALAREASLIDGNSLRNEYFEVEVDSETGGIRSIDKYDRRNNLLSQQISLRIPSSNHAQRGTTEARYTRMRCNQIESTNSTRISASITTQGDLIDHVDGVEKVVAAFKQVFHVRRGIPIIEVEVEIQPQIQLTPSPNHYFCSRIAWKNESADLIRNVQESKAHVVEDRFEAPCFVEIKDTTDSVVLLTGGLPYHRRSSRRMLDSLLMVSGEKKQRFRFGIGVDLKIPIQDAIGFMSPSLIWNSALTGGWFFHFNCKNVVATWWEPIFDDERGCVGVLLRVRETENRAGQLKIRCPRNLRSARRVNFLGEHLQDIEIDENTAEIRFHAAEFFQLELNWIS